MTREEILRSWLMETLAKIEELKEAHKNYSFKVDETADLIKGVLTQLDELEMKA